MSLFSTAAAPPSARPDPPRHPVRLPPTSENPSRSPANRRRFPFGRTAAFSLVELSVVILIISIVAAVAVPYWKEAHLRARSTAVVNDLRVFAEAFQRFAHDRSDWPAATLEPAQIPPGMETYIPLTGWQRVTPVGGAYTWARDTVQQGERYRAAILILSTGASRVTSDRQVLLDIDRKIDDGSLDTGNFRLGFRNQPVFVVEH